MSVTLRTRSFMMSMTKLRMPGYWLLKIHCKLSLIDRELLQIRNIIAHLQCIESAFLML